MKSEIQNNDVKPELPFPKLMIHAYLEVVVLMTKHSNGTVVHAGKSTHRIGTHIECWVHCEFKDFNGTVTLSN